MSAASREYYEDWQVTLTNDPDFYNWLDQLEQGDERNSNDPRKRVQDGSVESLGVSGDS